MRVIGVTGMICAGKNVLSDFIKEKYKADVYDCDEEAHRILDSSAEFVNELAGFEVNIKDSVQKREFLRTLVFSDERRRRKLEKFIWSSIDDEISIITKKNASRLFVINAPLLFQSGLDKYADLIFFADADAGIRKKRFVSRTGSADTFDERDKLQSTYFKNNKKILEQKKVCVIMNSMGKEDFLKKAEEVLKCRVF